MRFTLYRSNCLEVPENCTYPHKVEVTGKDSLIEAVLAGFDDSINSEEDVELRPCSFATFGFHVIAAVVNRKGNTGKSSSNV